MDWGNSEQIFKKFLEYIEERPETKILICTPMYGGLCQLDFMRSILQLFMIFQKHNIKNDLVLMGGESLVQRARNSCVAKFMDDKEATHMIFIDADVSFNYIEIIKLILRDKDIVAGVYPKKNINWEKVRKAIINKNNVSEYELKIKSSDYVFNPIIEDGNIEIDYGLIRVKNTGTGFLCIKRKVFKKLFRIYPNLKYKNNVAGYGSGDNFYSLFDCEIDQESKVYLSEDFLFCKRCIENGFNIYVDITITLGHTGNNTFIGSLYSALNGDLLTLDKDLNIK